MSLRAYNHLGIFGVMTETLTMVDGRTVLRMERRFAHPPAKVWRAITDPSELAGWFPAAVELDLRLDGRIQFTFGAGEDDFVEDPDNTGTIRAYDPPRLLEYNWGREVLRWELSPDGDGCLIVLTATYDDRPASASLTSGWLLCFAELDRVLGGPVAAPGEYPELHEHFVREYGLDEGTVERESDGSWTIRFERQLTRPKDLVWSFLSGGAEPQDGSRAPQGFVAKGIEPGIGSTVTAPTSLGYGWQYDGTVHWQLRDGNGGARVVLTHTGPAEAAPHCDELYDAWHDLIEGLAADIRSL